ncbi:MULTISPECIES: sporulation protein YunB [Paenibacillus]|uniref:sporulation protein YunB n=1 Tax=Paenibacillus TaxID=44249 RepID=UPI0022B905AA|nr:sporulation protein YunB [Paenibacillus caseinilyticus]MCZ8522790.1 sporulation protein YunB [Paenibacillus caseinilyticus]
MLRRRWRSSPTGRARTKRNLLISLVVVVLLLLQLFLYIERNLKPPLAALAKVRVKQIATETINGAITEQMAKNTSFDKLIDWKTDRSGKVTAFMLNNAEHLRVTADTVRIVQQQLDRIASMPEEVPLGQAMDSPLLASFGPDIPIRLVPAGSAKVDLSTRHQNAGINNVLVEVFVRIRVEVNIIIPFDTVPEVVETEIPISYSLVVGDVPTYYFDAKGNPAGGAGAAAPGMTVPDLNLLPKGPSAAAEASEE